ncbi:3-hydroxybutyryl-CoA dehydrogenase [Anaerobacterium chartisolvens]|uniref:3-hydroxybutyryl-CoA dehydrogenase n=1 Tax=Anaerobacterium chartisolvens TaxID=1297424 RepID=A0A369AMV6_9FIRM|nr:3-hydroxyacyl-CoA dehydrogenase family protein [Anaerobacterium chartisolvens]RCX10511.1 3-hydroxybutyryl-CoA dehydrogenase [Anaerobacterium chartisolvens]
MDKIERVGKSYMLKNILIQGGGTMAQGIAIECLRAGCDVFMWHHTDSKKPVLKVTERLDSWLKSDKIPASLHQAMLHKIHPADDTLSLCGFDIIIESIVEDFHHKEALLLKVDEAAPAHTIICTNTSSFSINSLGKRLTHPERFIGLHFFNPVDRTGLVEIVRGGKTSGRVIELIKLFCRLVGKEYVLLEDSPGFIVNRLLMAYLNNAANLLKSNIAGAEDIDRAMKLGTNHPMGPFQLCDLIGIDTVYNILSSLYCELKDKAYKPCTVFKSMTDLGLLGRKTGEGFYKYIKAPEK